MKAIILAAGKGERLWPLTSTRPKPCLPLLDKPLITYHVNHLIRNGVRDLIVVTHYMGDLVKNTLLSTTKQQNINIEFVRQEKPMGTGDAVKTALNDIEGEDRVLILYSDIFLSENAYKKFFHMIREKENIALGAKTMDISRYGELVLDKENRVIVVREKTGETRPGIINAGLMVLDTKILQKEIDSIKVSVRGEYEITDALNSIASKSEIHTVVVEETTDWKDIGTPWDYMDINFIFLKNVCREKNIEPEKCVIASEEANIQEPNVFEGPVFLGKNVNIGPFSHLRGPVIIHNGAKIGFGVQVKASIILEEAKIPHLNYVGDSIIGEKTNLGAGTIVANLRHDKKTIKTMLKGKLTDTGRIKFGTVIGGQAKTGINTSIYPGIKIGAGVWISPGCIIDRDVPDYTIVKCKQEKTVIERRQNIGNEANKREKHS